MLTRGVMLSRCVLFLGWFVKTVNTEKHEEQAGWHSAHKKDFEVLDADVHKIDQLAGTYEFEPRVFGMQTGRLREGGLFAGSTRAVCFAKKNLYRLRGVCASTVCRAGEVHGWN